MKRAIAKGDIDSAIERVENEGKQIRNMLNDIVLYSEGAYSIKDLYIMPMYFIKEILDRIEDKRKKTEEEIQKANGKNLTVF